MPVYFYVIDAIVSKQQGNALSAEKRSAIENALKDREPLLEREMLEYMLEALSNLPANQRFAAADNFGTGSARRKAEEDFARTIAEGEEFNSAEDIINLYGMSIDELRAKYPAVMNFAIAHAAERAAAAGRLAKFNSEIDPLRLQYQQATMEMKGTNPYPDANATLRFTFGNVKGYSPRESVMYSPFTTLRGVLEKDTGKDPFAVPFGLKKLQQDRDFGRYGVGGTVPVNFLATTDIIGGNSGSPVMNGEGEMVGIAFDSNFEGLGNDIFFSPDYGRTIAVDMRYVLFVTEKFGGAGWILNEMDIKGGARARNATASR
jgi:hypothetical protein